MLIYLFSVAVTFFLIMDPLGNIPLFLVLLSKYSPKRQRQIILRELLIALFVMIFFYYLGELILDLLHISRYTVQISGGLILFLIALQMIFPKNLSPEEKALAGEPFIVPLAIPLVAGPSLLAAIMIYSHQTPKSSVVLGAILIAWVFTTIILLASSWFARLLGPRGLKACERMMGLILTLLAVQLFLEGIENLIHAP